MELLKKIAGLKTKINSMRPLNQGELSELKKWYRVSYTYNSNAIEGNSLTLEETKMVLEEGLTIDGKPLREIYEVVNHAKAVDLLYESVKNDEPVTESLIRNVHKVVLQQIDDENAGMYRNIQVFISGEEKPLPKSDEVPVLMQELFEWYEQDKSDHELKIIAEWHYRFVKIHPFVDGNGRLARLIVNLMLLKKGYPLQIIPVIRRREYIQSLHSSKIFDDFYEFFLSVQYENMKDYLRMIDSNAL